MAGIDRVVSVATALGGACALRDDRTVWCWGGSFEASMGSPVPVRNDWR